MMTRPLRPPGARLRGSTREPFTRVLMFAAQRQAHQSGPEALLSQQPRVLAGSFTHVCDFLRLRPAHVVSVHVGSLTGLTSSTLSRSPVAFRLSNPRWSPERWLYYQGKACRVVMLHFISAAMPPGSGKIAAASRSHVRCSSA